MIGLVKSICVKSSLPVVCLALMLVPAVSSQANLVPDPSFETLENGTTYDGSNPYLGNAWLFNVGNSAGTVTVASRAQEGSNCMEISRTVVGDPWWNYDVVLSTYPWYNGGGIKVTAGNSYNVSFWAKTDSTNTDLKFSVASLNTSASYLNTDWADYDLTTTWTKYTYSYIAPANAACAQLSFRGTFNIVGNVYLDNVSMTAVPEPTSLLTTLSAMVGLVGFVTRRRK